MALDYIFQGEPTNVPAPGSCRSVSLGIDVLHKVLYVSCGDGWEPIVNREIVIPGGAGIYPLTGDVLSSAGSPTVRVVGLQGISVESIVPNPGAVLTFNQNTVEWEPRLRACIQINGLTESDDYDISINANHVSVNGTPIS